MSELLLVDLGSADVRRNDLDALRAFAMLLGIVLHSALSFMDSPWAVHDRNSAPGVAFLVAAIHGFRMPLFFLLSGYFTAMLWRKRGLRGLLQHRVKRIALPLAFGWLAIVPAMWGIWVWAASGNTDNQVGDASKEIWTAAASGDLDAVRDHAERGFPLDLEEPTFGQSPLGWAVICGQNKVVEYLIEAGADPNARYRDRNSALHTAALFGQVNAAEQLLDAGASVNLRNSHGETPLDALRHDRSTTEHIAGLFTVSIDFDVVAAGRDEIRLLFENQDAISGLANPVESDGIDEDIGGETNTSFVPRVIQELVRKLMYGDIFSHPWFLWFLCWLVLGFAAVVFLLQYLPPLKVPSTVIATPLSLVWLVPLTMFTQSFMHLGGAMPGFGPDLSAGLIPIPNVLGYHATFYGFGALLFCHSKVTDRLGRDWWIQLPLALLLLPVALAVAFNTSWGRELAGGTDLQRFLANLGQVLYAWLMIFGLIGLSEVILNRQRPWVRYASDSSYWLYLVHLPLVIVGQALLRNVDLPASLKLTIHVVVITAMLLVSYEFLVRYTWGGNFLNGPRTRRVRSKT